MMNSESILFLCINLERAPERRRFVEGEAAREGIEVKFLAAVDGKNLSYDGISNYDRKTRLCRYGKDMTLGEIACVLSHKFALETFLTSEARACVILEDDVTLREGFRAGVDVLFEALSVLDFIKLHQFPSDWKAVGQIGDFSLRYPQKVGCGTAAIYYSRAGAERVLSLLQRFHGTMDGLLYGVPFLKLAMTEPSLVGLAESAEASTIDQVCARQNSRCGKKTLAQVLCKWSGKIRKACFYRLNARATKSALEKREKNCGGGLVA